MCVESESLRSRLGEEGVLEEQRPDRSRRTGDHLPCRLCIFMRSVSEAVAPLLSFLPSHPVRREHAVAAAVRGHEHDSWRMPRVITKQPLGPL